MKELEEENRRLKKIVADLTLEIDAVKHVLKKSGRCSRETDGRRRDAIGVRRSCALAGISRSVAQYERQADPSDLVARLKELAAERPRFGYRRLHVLLVREGWRIHRKRVLRMYQEHGLQVRRKKRKQVSRASRRPKKVPTRRSESWSMDSMSDAFTDGRVFRVFNLVDDLTREAVAMEPGVSLTAPRVIRALERAIEERGQPRRLTMDNGPEFTSRALDAWAYERGIELHFIRPGKPIENAYVESFNGRVREECLNQHCVRDLDEAAAILEDWRVDYNDVRPHGSLGQRTPAEYAASLEEDGYPSSSTGQADACRHPLNNER